MKVLQIGSQKNGQEQMTNLYFSLADKDLFIYPVNMWLGYYYRWHEEQSTWGMHKEEKKFDLEIKKYWKEKWKI